jgi:hypothetical protein
MKKFLLAVCGLAAVVLLSTGCSTTSIERVEPDGTSFKATNKRALWKSQGVKVTYTRNGTNVTANAELDQSGSDAAAVAEATARGVAAGLKGGIAQP